MSSKASARPIVSAAQSNSRKGVVHALRSKTKVPLGESQPAASGGSGAGSFPGFIYNGGPVVHNPQVYTVFLGDWSSAANQGRITRLNQFISDLMNSDYMNMLAQYGCGSTGTFVNHIEVANSSTSFNDSDLQTILQTNITNGNIPEPTSGSSIVFIIFLADAAVVVDQSICEPNGNFGYHFHFTTTAGNPCYYAVVPGLSDTCLTTACGVGNDANCSVHLAQTQEQRQTKVLSHEFSEMVSDPEVSSNEAWTEPTGSHENGDICNFAAAGTITVGANTWTVQPMYSKWDDLISNGATTCVFGSPTPLPSLLPRLYFVVDKNTFGKDEVTDQPVWSNAFSLVLEGYNINEVGSALPQPFTGSFPALGGVTINAGPIKHENSGDQFTPQRITFYFNIQFSSPAPNIFPSSGQTQKLLNASIVVQGITLRAETVIDLVAGADPYFTNVDPSQNNAFWLSQDLRVFTATAGQSPVAGAPAFTNDAYASIQSLITFLNSSAGFTTPSSTDPLNALPNQTGYETGDTSVTPLNGSGQQNYNFAVARVRLRGSSGTVGEALSVKVFFRLFVAQSCDTDFQPLSTYLSQITGGLPEFPLPSGTGLVDPSGQSIQTIPFFATGASGTGGSTTDYGTGGVNNQTIEIPSGQDSVWAYFGCFLDVYDSSNNSKFGGTHHCIVAQIAYDGAPLVNPPGVTLSPGNSDKLAQRNLQITSSGNPGPASTHRVPQAFDLRTSGPIAARPGQLLDYPDELVIDWGNTPPGSKASIYWPQVNSADVLKLAARLYTTHLLSAEDGHTIQCTTTKGLTYVPIPIITGQNFAGLFTVDLPPTVRTGQELNIVVRRISTRRNDNLRVAGDSAGAISVGKNLLRNWRYVVGTFQVKIPISNEEAMLLPEENTLAILKWRLQSKSPVDRWYPVLQRFISYVEGRVQGSGGDPTKVPPSPTGFGHRPKPGHGKGGECHPGSEEFTGKIEGIIYDRFGDFEGFLLRTEHGCERCFRSREHKVEELVRAAWIERTVISVFVTKCDLEWPASIVLRRPR